MASCFSVTGSCVSNNWWYTCCIGSVMFLKLGRNSTFAYENISHFSKRCISLGNSGSSQKLQKLVVLLCKRLVNALSVA